LQDVYILEVPKAEFAKLTGEEPKRVTFFFARQSVNSFHPETPDEKLTKTCEVPICSE